MEDVSAGEDAGSLVSNSLTTGPEVAESKATSASSDSSFSESDPPTAAGYHAITCSVPNGAPAIVDGDSYRLTRLALMLITVTASTVG